MFYEDHIDEKRTVQKMKHYLAFLGKHMNSISYQDYLHQQKPPMIKEELMDYVNYTDSIIHLEKRSASSQTLLDVMQYKDNVQKQKEERENQIRWLCLGIEHLPKKQRAYILERYVYHMDNQTILKRHGIVESTLNRNLRKAYLNLAIMLKLEVMKEE